MSDRKLAKKLQPLLKQVWKLSRRLTKAMINWLLRTVFLLNRRPRSAGFVLPTAVFLILVVTLTTGALTFRSFNSTTRTIGNVQSRQIYNAATPAIDRARAKLDYLFGKDSRLPSGIPAEEFVISMLLNDGLPVGAGAVSAPSTADGARYTFSEDTADTSPETRIDIDGNGRLDNAWIYTDKNTNSSVIYSITLSTPDLVEGDPTTLGPLALLRMSDETKANGDPAGPFTRSGPLSNSEAISCRAAGGGSTVEQGWYQDQTNTSILRKRFQVDAFVVSNDTVNKGRPTNFTTLEFAQDRKLDRGNKWGAWFKYDLEVTPGAKLNWNGAMHSEGSILIGRSVSPTSGFSSYLISSPSSCLFRPASNSEMSARQFDEQNGDVRKKFFGIIGAGDIKFNNFSGESEIHTYKGSGYQVPGKFTSGNDWKVDGGKGTLEAIATDPKVLLTQDIQQAIAKDFTNKDDRISEAAIETNPYAQQERFFVTETNTQPYVDDTYRADNRYGPKVRYKNIAGATLGTEIPTSNVDLTGEDGTTGKQVGLDGYWERRTFKDSDTSSSEVYTGGMRILVGERLELGNPYGWVAPQDRPVAQQDLTSSAITPGDGTFDNLRSKTYTSVPVTDANLSKDNSDNPGDPLYPPYSYPDADRAHEAKQRRALRDNLGAVQAAAVYHYDIGDGRTPAACLVTTAHPGSPYTLRRSVDFTKIEFKDRSGETQTLLTDFFYGKGTNGWEFAPPTTAQLQPGQPLGDALVNLANFAGDYDSATKVGGAFPPTQDGGIHPDPTLTMWGNFSNLKRAITAGNNSPADQSYLQTAGCTLGALAYNIDQVQKFDTSTKSGNGQDLGRLGRAMYLLMDGNPANDEVAVPLSPTYNPRDYDRVTPDMFLAKLPTALADPSIGILNISDQKRLLDMAFLIHEKFQIRRDRTYGFRPSPAANTWNYNPYIAELGATAANRKITLWSSACDPNMFDVYTPANAIVPTTDPDEGADPVEAALQKLPATGNPSLAFANRGVRSRLALSRLCGTVIPPGSVHDFPGDYNYPARNDTAGGITNLPQKSDSTLVTQANDEEPALGNLTDVPSGYDANNATFKVAGNPLNTAPYDDSLYKRALVSPKFPSLYYIFPEFDHDQTGKDDTATASIKVDHRQPGKIGFDLVAAFQPWAEPYIDKTEGITNSYKQISAAPVAKASLAPYKADFGALGNFTGRTLPTDAKFAYTSFPAFPIADTSVADAALEPRAAIANWVLPTNATTNNPNRVIAPDGTVAVVPFQDKVAFNGREWLPSRVLDVDLDMLRNAPIENDTWLPVSGIVYAFREDAVREDSIARPNDGLAYTNAQTPGAETDPLKDGTFGVSVKAVDFIPDPDRRPNGFRLRNGATLKRGGSVPDAVNLRGLSFITDQPAYIMGDFNLHQERAGGARLEEFVEQLPDDPTQYSTATFYDNRTTRETKFADPAIDMWRPSEVLADTVIMLSDQFCDGSAIDTFMTAGSTTPGSRLGIDNTSTFSGNAPKVKDIYTNGAELGGKVYNDQTKALFAPGCDNDATNGATSFLNQNRPEKDLTGDWNWVRENPGDVYSPVKISRNGNGLIVNNATGVPSPTDVPIEYSSANDTAINGTYFKIDDTDNRARALQDRGTDATATTVNAILISNIIPSRANQQNGALNNFPRFLEDWRDGAAKVRFAGSFLQLGFSNYATAPFDQDRWEPTGTDITSGTTEYTSFFRPPARLWGYDVALQLAQASPAATRFTTPSSEKNEFYTEPAANDPYMQNLCKALRLNAPTGLDAAKLNCPA